MPLQLNPRAYTVSPFVFLSILLVSSVLAIHFMKIDRDIASSISRESRVVKGTFENEVQYLNFRAFALTLAYQKASRAEDMTALESALLSNLSAKFNVSDLVVQQVPEGFIISMYADIPTRIKDTVSHTSGDFEIGVDYPFSEAAAYADRFNTDPIDCLDLGNQVEQRIADLRLPAEWEGYDSSSHGVVTARIYLYLRTDRSIAMNDSEYHYRRTYEVLCQ